MTDYLIGNQEEMYQWAYRLTRNYDDAQDLLQSTLLCALKSVGMYTCLLYTSPSPRDS
mgnify:CR=1 FL=1